MKIERLKRRLRRDRPMISVTLRIPEDVVEDLKYIAPLRGFSGYQPLMRAYIGQGLRTDLQHYESPLLELIEGLKRAGVSEAKIEQALAEVGNLVAPDEVPAGPAVAPKPGHEKKHARG
jgi:hypothetical protein